MSYNLYSMEKLTFLKYMVMMIMLRSNLIILKIYNGSIYNILSMSYIRNSWLMISCMRVNEYKFLLDKIHKKHII